MATARGVSAKASFHFTARVISSRTGWMIAEAWWLACAKDKTIFWWLLYQFFILMCGILHEIFSATCSIACKLTLRVRSREAAPQWQLHLPKVPRPLLTVHCRQITARPAHHLHLIYSSTMWFKAHKNAELVAHCLSDYLHIDQEYVYNKYLASNRGLKHGKMIFAKHQVYFPTGEFFCPPHIDLRGVMSC